MDAETYREIAEIRNELGRQGGLLRTLVFAQAEPLGDLIIGSMEKDPVLARIFLLLDRPMTQLDVVSTLSKEVGLTGVSQPSISRKMEKLEKELGIITPVSSGGKATPYIQNEASIAMKIEGRIKRHPVLKKLI